MNEQSASTPRFGQLYRSTIARVLGWFAVFMTVISIVGALGGRARIGNLIGALIFGSAAFLLLWAAPRIRAAGPMSERGSMVGQIVVLAATCLFDTVVVYRWLMHQFPSSKFVLLMVFGMCVVGAVAGFAVSALANIAFRSGPPKLRLPLTAIVWLTACAAITEWLINSGADPNRTFIVGAITAISGLVVGTLNAELIVGRWYLRRHARSREADQSRNLTIG